MNNNSKRVSVCLIFGMLVVAALVTQNAWSGSGNSQNAHSGTITGRVNVCGDLESAGVRVFTPGQPFVVITGASGTFFFYNVPAGSYSVRVEPPEVPPIVMSPVDVVKNETTDLGLISICPDSDQDGFQVDVDCNDLNANIFPGAEEICDGFDNNCDGVVDEGCQSCTDTDNDGFFAQTGCGTLADCDDELALINPAAADICGDGIDNNCSGYVDEGCPADNDSDGYDATIDCDDSNPWVFPGAVELCDDGLDNDCNQLIDCDDGSCWDEPGLCPYLDLDGDGWTTFDGDCDDTDFTINPHAYDAPETPWDENCDGVNAIWCWIDSDFDAYSSNERVYAPDGVCDQGQQSFNGWDCNDSDPMVNMGQIEICGNQIDDNCNGGIDESCP